MISTQPTRPCRKVANTFFLAAMLLLVNQPTSAIADSAIPTVDRLGELQSELAIAKAETALAKARLELATSGGNQGSALEKPHQPWAASASSIPIVKSITGPSSHLVAKVVFPDGSHANVQEGFHIGEYTVKQITAANVILADKHNSQLTLELEK